MAFLCNIYLKVTHWSKKGELIENRVIIKNMSDALFRIIPSCSDVSLINHITNNKFSYTDNVGVTSIYLVYKSYNAYKKSVAEIPHKLFKSNSFYIAELL